jgi:hypothetical protein
VTLNASLFALALPALALAMPVAASNVDLRVVGSILPDAACAMTIGNGAVNLGRINLSDLNADPTKPTHLGERAVKMEIHCASKTRYALLLSSTSQSDGDTFDLGLVSAADRSKVGSLNVLFDSGAPLVDGARGYYTSADAGDLAHASWGPSVNSTLLLQTGTFAMGFVKTHGSTEAPPAIKDASTRLLVRPSIKPSNDIDLSTEITFAGDMTFELRYL